MFSSKANSQNYPIVQFAASMLISVALLLAAPMVSAHDQRPDNADPLKIHKVFIDYGNNTMEIEGVNLKVGSSTPKVYIWKKGETIRTTLSPVSASSTKMVVNLPTPLLVAGEYLVYLNRGFGILKDDDFSFSYGTGSGAPGPQGPVGPVGPQGPIGLTGAVGPQGPAGAVGAVGPQGPIGLTGAIGPQGPIGLTGAVGPQGPAGADGQDGVDGQDGATGPQGPIGLTGPAGADGAAGPIGPAGADGAVGPAGPAGPIGPAGADGATGPSGPQGPAGPQGPQGVAPPETCPVQCRAMMFTALQSPVNSPFNVNDPNVTMPHARSVCQHNAVGSVLYRQAIEVQRLNALNNVRVLPFRAFEIRTITVNEQPQNVCTSQVLPYQDLTTLVDLMNVAAFLEFGSQTVHIPASMAASCAEEAATVFNGGWGANVCLTPE